MDKITDDWITYLRVFNHVGVVEADDVGTTEVDFVLWVIKDPAETVPPSPFADIGIEGIVASIGQRFLEVGNAAQCHWGIKHGSDGAQDVVVFCC